MAVSKAFLFTDEEQAAAQFGVAFAHPARVTIIRRLMGGHSMAYDDLVGGMPIDQSTADQHLRILVRGRFVEPSLLPNNLAGYRLDMERYRHCANAVRSQFRTMKTVPIERHLRSLPLGEVE
jgi:DNA-binding transcriptional ArsR family regulator